MVVWIDLLLLKCVPADLYIANYCPRSELLLTVLYVLYANAYSRERFVKNGQAGSDLYGQLGTRSYKGVQWGPGAKPP